MRAAHIAEPGGPEVLSVIDVPAPEVGPGEVLLTMAGRQKLCVLLYVGALGTNIGLNVTLIPHFGLAGAAVATAAAMLVEALLLHVAVRRTLGIVLFAFANPLPPLHSKKTY